MRRSSSIAAMIALLPVPAFPVSALQGLQRAPMARKAAKAVPILCPAGVTRMNAVIARSVATHAYPGAVYAVSIGGRIGQLNAVGVSDAVSGAPMRPEMIFRLASMSKPITAAAIMMLVDAGKLRLDDPVARYIPEFRWSRLKPSTGSAAASPIVRPITIRHLLTHTSGLDSDLNALRAGMASYPARTTLAARMPSYASSPLGWQPGSRFAYSPLAGFEILSRVIEVVSGMPFDRFLGERIFRPLHMSDTGFRLDARQRGRLVSLYAAEGGRYTPGTSPFASDTYFSGAAGLFGTAGDCLRFATMLDNGGRLDGVRLLTRRSVAAMHAIQLPAGFPGLDADAGWGLAMRVVARDPHLPAGSYGWSGAHGTHFWIDPAHRVVAVFMMNLSNAAGADAPSARQFEALVVDAVAPRCGLG